jgi:hypothetical protein
MGEDEPDVRVYPRGLEDEVSNGPPTSVVTHRGCKLVLRFGEGDFEGEGDVQEIRLLPDSKPLQPRVLRQFAPRAELYLAYARSAMRILRPEETVEGRRGKWESFRNSAEALREIAGPGRGLPPEFYKSIGEEHRALVTEGEPHPVKTLGENHHVTISAASRWLKEARRRGYVEGGENDAR